MTDSVPLSQYTALVAERDALADVVGALQSVCAVADATIAALRRDLANPPPDVQEKVLAMHDHTQLAAERDALAARVAELDQEHWDTDKLIRRCNELVSEKHGVEIERDRLTASLAAAHGLQARAERAEARELRLRTALDHYGKHDYGCEMYQSFKQETGRCYCGLSEIRAALAAVPS